MLPAAKKRMIKATSVIEDAGLMDHITIQSTVSRVSIIYIFCQSVQRLVTWQSWDQYLLQITIFTHNTQWKYCRGKLILTSTFFNNVSEKLQTNPISWLYQDSSSIHSEFKQQPSVWMSIANCNFERNISQGCYSKLMQQNIHFSSIEYKWF